jgi:hypothetical protein
MRVANPRPLSRRETTGTTKDEIAVGWPVVVGGPQIVRRVQTAPLCAGPHQPGLNDAPTAVRAREDR